MLTHAERLRGLARNYPPGILEQERRALDAGAKALDTLADPSVVHVTRADAEQALERARDCGQSEIWAQLAPMGSKREKGHEREADSAMAEARRLLGLEPSDG
jgi:hypothetical protein